MQYVIYDSPFDEDDPDAKRSGQAHTATIRSQIMVWPQASDAPAGGTSPRDRETEPPVASNAAAGKGDAFPAVLPDDVPLTCWEVAPGTAVEDAIGHIAKLGSGAMGNASMPFSPRQQQSSSLASDSTSEISHEDHPPAADKAAKQAAAALSRQTSEAERPLASLQADALLTVGGPRTFSLRIGDAPLVKVSIHPPQAGPLQPGSMLAGTLEFPQGDSGPTDASPLRCERVTVLLETEEAVEAAWRPQGKSGSTGLLRRVHDEHIEMTPDTIATHFLFSLPPDATPSFQTPLVALRWVLRFHFVARRGKGKATEQLAWTLPVPVLPPQV